MSADREPRGLSGWTGRSLPPLSIYRTSTRSAPEKKVRIVLSVLPGDVSISTWRNEFLHAGKHALTVVRSLPAAGRCPSRD